MGAALCTIRTGISVPALARLMGLTHTRLYQLIRDGRGPKLTPITRSPRSHTDPKTESFVTYDDAIAWLEGRDPERQADAIRHLKIEKIMSELRNPQPRKQTSPHEARWQTRCRREAEQGLALANFSGSRP